MNSAYDIKKAGMLKRIAAFLFDMVIALSFYLATDYVISQPVASAYTAANYTQYETINPETSETIKVTFPVLTEIYSSKVDDYYSALVAGGVAYYSDYEFDSSTYSTIITCTTDDDNLCDNYDANSEALLASAEFTALHEEVNMLSNAVTAVTMGMFAFSSLIACLLTFFVFPLIFKNGQTLGKKMLNLALISTENVRVKNWQILARVLIGAWAIECVFSFYTFVLTYVLPLGLLVSIIMAVFSKKRMALHDFAGGTIVVDYSATIIVDTVEERKALIEEENKAKEESKNAPLNAEIFQSSDSSTNAVSK